MFWRIVQYRTVLLLFHGQISNILAKISKRFLVTDHISHLVIQITKDRTHKPIIMEAA